MQIDDIFGFDRLSSFVDAVILIWSSKFAIKKR